VIAAARGTVKVLIVPMPGLKIASARFVKSAVSPEQFPAGRFPEIAFVGRSNVGKSSLINSLLGTPGLAKTSSTPGRTQLINFFQVNDGFYFVDLPGYGYARVPLEIKRTWGPMVQGYLETRSNLVLVVVITDARHEPAKLDLQMTEWLQSRRKPFVVIATKSDKLSANKLKANMALVTRAFSGAIVIPYSSLTRRGADQIWREIVSAAGIERR
jgi:GTP-binding protein